jgi:hypothetical protein
MLEFGRGVWDILVMSGNKTQPSLSGHFSETNMTASPSI